MIDLTLYTTLGCHLCERQEALLAALIRGAYRLEKVEISEDDTLAERYGVRIPVLRDVGGSELDRGFEPQRLADWLAARGWLDETAWQTLRAGEAPAPQAGAPRVEVRHGRRYLG
ncbi:glutaredoxin family protein [Billgrantia endophytica]|uniref:Glutaredoxin family protein n=1 Tax=Billgrantia endophytica TaxID=2033802 RepID=A0A2N7U4U3_9GAMM|nr:glutaredoxin family protein [Halomonas endophytica]PMR75447.1 glutaredoxin family protein [Halomonas endophytica]